MKLSIKSRRIRHERRDRRSEPVRGHMARPFREVSFRSFPFRLEDLHLAPHGVLDTVGQPVLVGRVATSKMLGPNPRRERLVPRFRGPSHRVAS